MKRSPLVWVILLLIGLTLGLLIPNLVVSLNRRWYGVAPQVELESYQVGRLLPDELDLVLKELANQLEVAPQNAYYDLKGGRVIPETLGRRLAMAETKRLVLTAAEGEKVRAVLKPVYPEITHVYFQPVFRGDLTKQAMALMINVAWGNEYIPGMLQVLRDADVKVTFFFIGDWVERFPNLFQQIVAAEHEIANHGYWHGQPRKMSIEEQQRLITKAQEVMVTAGATPVKLFAPPAGEYDERLLRTAATLGYRTILWTLDTVDWKRPASQIIYERVVGKAQNGALVLMHPTEPTLQALPSIIKDLKVKGYELLTVSQIIAP